MGRRFATPRAAYCGWLQLPGGPWKLVCQGATQAEAEEKLLRVPVPEGVTSCKRMVLVATQVPTKRRAEG
jgi:hypothetical protein